jgi:uncharacterized protein
MNKLENLINWFGNKRTIVALSGGVDSALVAYAAYQKLGDMAIAVTADYKTLAKEELDTAKNVCREIGISQILLNYNELENQEFVKNDSNRCYHCRNELGTRLIKLGRENNIELIVDGTNLDDLGDYRPGLKALEQNGIRSPLVENKFTKIEIRDIAKSVGLSVYDKPSNSCLASRIPWGQKITAERLLRIELAESIVKQMTSLRQLRVRDMNGMAKLEIEKVHIPNLDQKIVNEITVKLKTIGFSDLVIDPEGYKPGKINVIAD